MGRERLGIWRGVTQGDNLICEFKLLGAFEILRDCITCKRYTKAYFWKYNFICTIFASIMRNFIQSSYFLGFIIRLMLPRSHVLMLVLLSARYSFKSFCCWIDIICIITNNLLIVVNVKPFVEIFTFVQFSVYCFPSVFVW